MCVFFGKKQCNRLSVWGFAPEPPFTSGDWELRAQTTALFLPPTDIVLSGAFGLRLCFILHDNKGNNYN